MARRSRTPESSNLDRIFRSTSPEPQRPSSTVETGADEWGATVMPSWLDTAAGRSAWAGRRTLAGEGGAADLDADGGTDGGTDGDLGAERLSVDDESYRDRYGDDRYEDDRYEDDRYGDEPDAELDDEAEDDWAAPRRRFAMLPPAAIGLIGIGAIACVIAAFALLGGNEPVVPLVDLPASAGPTAAAEASAIAGESPAASGQAERIVVSVAGLVHKPGLVTLAPNSRVAQALDLAGGARPNADVLSLNLAQVLRDGDQVLVGTREDGANSVRSAVVSSGSGRAPAGGGVAGNAAAGTPTGEVNLNTATAADLDALPGVGPVTAQAIIAWREQHGGFASVDQLAEVDGIGPGKLAKLRGSVTVG